MGYYVHIHVCFSCDENEPVAELAKKHLPAVIEKASGNGPREAVWFLESLSTRTGNNPGPKGGLSLWGMTGNYTRVDEFVEVLKPFWEDLLYGDDDCGPCSHEHILVFEEAEQSERTTAYEIMLTGENDEPPVIVKVHECPFAFMQF